MRCVSTLVLLIAGILSAQTSDEFLATELIAMLKSLKDVYAEAGRLAPITIRLVNEMPTWDNERLNREFEAFWNAANAETSSETVQGRSIKPRRFCSATRSMERTSHEPASATSSTLLKPLRSLNKPLS